MGADEKQMLIELPFWDAGEVCVVCGNPRVHHHHVLYGRGVRKKADKWGYIIPLCYEHHLGGAGIHYNRGMSLYWKELAQKHFEKHNGSREDFIREFGRSYL